MSSQNIFDFLHPLDLFSYSNPQETFFHENPLAPSQFSLEDHVSTTQKLQNFQQNQPFPSNSPTGRPQYPRQTNLYSPLLQVPNSSTPTQIAPRKPVLINLVKPALIDLVDEDEPSKLVNKKRKRSLDRDDDSMSADEKGQMVAKDLLEMEGPKSKKARILDEKTDRLFELVKTGSLQDFKKALFAAATQAVDSKGYALLHYAVLKKGEVGFIQMLVEAGAPIDKRDFRDNTPLHLASMINSIPHIKELLRLGANRDLSNKIPKKPVELCTKKLRYLFDPTPL